MVWRSAIVASYIGLAITCSFVLGGGVVVLMFFAVWGLVWLAFSLFWGWAEQLRRALLKRPSSS